MRPDARLAPDTARFRLYDAVVRLCRLVDHRRAARRGARRRARRGPVVVAAPAVPRRAPRRDGACSSSRPIATPTRLASGFADVLAQLVRERNTTRLRLGGLDADGVAEVIGGRDGHRRRRNGWSRRFRELTDGNPLYVGEAARLLATEGRLDDTLDSDRLLIPRDVRETVLRRLGQLSEPLPARARARVGARPGLPARCARTHSAGDDVDVMAALDEAASVAVIVDSPDRAGHLRFGARGDVRGALPRDPVVAAAPPPRRSRSHARGAPWTRPRPAPRRARAPLLCEPARRAGGQSGDVRAARRRARRAAARVRGGRSSVTTWRSAPSRGAPDGIERMELLLRSR